MSEGPFTGDDPVPIAPADPDDHGRRSDDPTKATPAPSPGSDAPERVDAARRTAAGDRRGEAGSEDDDEVFTDPAIPSPETAPEPDS